MVRSPLVVRHLVISQSNDCQGSLPVLHLSLRMLHMNNYNLKKRNAKPQKPQTCNTAHSCVKSVWNQRSISITACIQSIYERHPTTLRVPPCEACSCGQNCMGFVLTGKHTARSRPMHLDVPFWEERTSRIVCMYPTCRALYVSALALCLP